MSDAPAPTRAEEGRETCAHCGAKLTAEEREFYGNGCETCEGRLHAALVADDLRAALEPTEVQRAEARAVQAEAEVARLTAALADANAACEIHAGAALDAEHWNERATAAEASASALRERVATLEAALSLCLTELDWQLEHTDRCGDPNYECPLQDINKPSDSHAEARHAVRTALEAPHADN